MVSINLRQLRDTRQLKSWLQQGETVELRERRRVLARIVPPPAARQGAPAWPDFAARARKLTRGRSTAAASTVVEERRRARY